MVQPLGSWHAAPTASPRRRSQARCSTARHKEARKNAPHGALGQAPPLKHARWGGDRWCGGQ